MQKRWMTVVVCVAAMCVSVRCEAQAAGGAAAVTAGTVMEPAKAFDTLLGSIEKQIVGAAKAMPAEKYEFAPSAGIFKPEQGVSYGTVRTFAQQLTHVAQANYNYFGSVTGTKPDVDVKALGDLKDKDAVVSALEASFAFAHKATATLSAQNAFQAVGSRGMTKVAQVAGGIAHCYDHYGQVVEYMRMNGVVPAGSKP